MVQFRCWSCNMILQVSDEYIGKRARCCQCSKTNVVPSPTSGPSPVSGKTFFPLGKEPKLAFSKLSRNHLAGGTFVLILVFVGIALIRPDCERQPRQKSYTPRTSDFVEAFTGDYWIIEENAISVLKEPTFPGNEAQLRRNTVTIINSGTKVEIIGTRQEWFGPAWKEVYVYDNNDQISAHGWIIGDTAKKARRVKKGFY